MENNIWQQRNALRYGGCQCVMAQTAERLELGMPRRDLDETPNTRKERYRLLVVDANADVRKIVSEILEPEDCDVFHQESLRELANRLSLDPPFDAILIDVYHPVEKFVEMIPLLKELFPMTEVVFMSRVDDERLWIESIQHGAYDLLPKPLDKRELRRIVINAIEKNRTA